MKVLKRIGLVSTFLTVLSPIFLVGVFPHEGGLLLAIIVSCSFFIISAICFSVYWVEMRVKK